MRSEEDLAALLMRLERKLMDPVVRRDREQVSALLTDDFREFGCSGRCWTRDAILDELAAEAAYAAPVMEDFAIRQIAPNTILATCRTVRYGNSANAEVHATLRSCIWVCLDHRWQMLFHQGTKVPLRCSWALVT